MTVEVDPFDVQVVKLLGMDVEISVDHAIIFKKTDATDANPRKLALEAIRHTIESQ